jgi:hypothetical protein
MAGEFFSNFMPDSLGDFDVDSMLSQNRPLGRIVLSRYLWQAALFLANEPGPNLFRRQFTTTLWTNYWLELLASRGEGFTGRMVPVNQVHEVLKPGEPSGVLFAGGLEGHRGHRFAVNWMLGRVRPILLLERDDYFKTKERGAPFLDLRARVSMWAYFDPRLTISVLPERDPVVPIDTHYENIFKQIGADYCFASKSDPLCQQKIARGKSAPFLLIPDMYVQRTTDKVEKLVPDIDFEGLHRLINTTDNVEKLMPDVDGD